MYRFILTLLALATTTQSLSAETWTIPVAGNAFRTQPTPGRLDGGKIRLRSSDDEETYSVFFSIDRPATISLSLNAVAKESDCHVLAVVGQQQLNVTLPSKQSAITPLGALKIEKAGYVRVDLKSSMPESFGAVSISELRVTSDQPDLKLDYVKDNGGNMFYWGRRGPSVHLSYLMPSGKQLSHAYSEVTVPVGNDPIGSFFMANGFAEGYFGFQVNRERERRVLFSIWSPYRTDNPREIPKEDRVIALAKGAEVHVRDFGNEGSGGQSYLVYPWKAGKTYRFLTEVRPDGKGNTRYTSWFGEKESNEWLLIASFRRPKTDKNLTRFHSFLENFSPTHGHLERYANYGNQWVRDIDDQWHQVTRARFTGDNTARRRYRLDYAGGVSGGQFFLRNCGFFTEEIAFDQVFERPSDEDKMPSIPFDSLPRD